MNVRIIRNGELVMAKEMRAVPRVGDTLRFAGASDRDPPRYAVVTEVVWALDTGVEDVTVRSVSTVLAGRVAGALEVLAGVPS